MPTKSPQYHLAVFGCQMNVSDGERAAKVLEDIGYTKANTEKEADLIMVLSCSVRQKAVDRIHGKIADWDKMKKKKPLVTILSGCVLPHDKANMGQRFDLVLDIKDLLNLPKELEKMKNTKLTGADKGIYQEKYADNYFAVKPKYANDFQAFVPVMTGCNAFCTYCAVPYTRGRELCRHPKEVIQEVFELVKHDYKEVTLLGQIINKYMVKVDEPFKKWLDVFLKEIHAPKLPELESEYYKDKNIFKFPQLLAVLASIPGNWWLRYTSSHPKWFTDELIDTLARYDRIPRHAHLPVQAGDDAVLKRMLRPYTIEEYTKIVKALRHKIPDLAVTTDCIVGFPGETEKQFQSTLNLFENVKYDMAFTAQFSPRPGSVAGKWPDDVTHKEKARREKELNEILKKTALEQNDKLLNKVVKVLGIKSKKSGKQYQVDGRTEGLKAIRFTSSKNAVGEFVKLRVTKSTPWHLQGELVK